MSGADTTGLSSFYHYDYLAEKRSALEAWGRKLTEISSGLREVAKENH